jgi:sec-independent protein translocase protein TatA
MLANIMGADGIIVIIAVVVVLLFGGSKLPKLARGLGSASHEFKKGLEEGNNESSAASDTPKSEAIPKDSSSSS